MRKPTPQQLRFLDWEMGAFFHFGIRTFYEGHRDWDGLPMPAQGFAPTALDCDQWIRTIKQTGMTYAILVCKHHDGFANWPSAHSDYSVRQTPWKNGQGDVVQEFVDACRRHDIAVGLYYSPAEQGYHERSPEAHDQYFIDQITELLGNYGKIDYLWFDGCGSEGHKYDTERIVRTIRGLQPDILIFNMWDPDTRWVGNEAGVASIDNSNIVSSLSFSEKTTEKDALGEDMFLPAECDGMLRTNWFYSEYDAHTLRPLQELLGLYEHSVGRGANLLINIAPDRRGLLPQPDARRLLEFGAALRARYGQPLSAQAQATEAGYELAFCLPSTDGVAAFDDEPLVNALELAEDLSDGEAVQQFRVLARGHKLYTPLCLHLGHTIGHKRIVRFPAIRARELVVEVTQSRRAAKLLPPRAFFVR